ncbi:carbamoyltransferase C-terminal domain-containing protein [Paraburkholderia phenazinium]|nr:carbamoyltransferase C-terminal domain-containing protein [Paraburkholderia phenazinium]
MGLAPYGEPRYFQTICDHLIDIKPDGSFWLNMEYFDYAVGDSMINEKFEKLFGGPRRKPEALITGREFDLAASIQLVLEHALLRLAKSVRVQTGQTALCLAGGVSLNCIANGKLLKARIFDDIWVRPAAGDSGGALGAALAGWHMEKKQPRKFTGVDSMKSALLGSSYSNDEVETALMSCGAVFRPVAESEMFDEVADLLAEGNVVGWFQGRMEFGPRSLGARAILGDARNVTMQSVLNLKIKNRESFRPFAPAILEEHVSAWFETDRPSPYMLFVVDVARIRRRALSEQEQGNSREDYYVDPAAWILLHNGVTGSLREAPPLAPASRLPPPHRSLNCRCLPLVSGQAPSKVRKGPLQTQQRLSSLIRGIA